MKAAIRARYSSDNQRPESIEDQVRSCMQLALSCGYVVVPEHVFSDEAKSGALRDRPGLEALRAEARDLTWPRGLNGFEGQQRSYVSTHPPHLLPETIRDKRSALAAEERRVASFIRFIGDGNGTQALGDALEEAERRARSLTEELAALEATAKSVFRAAGRMDHASAAEARRASRIGDGAVRPAPPQGPRIREADPCHAGGGSLVLPR